MPRYSVESTNGITATNHLWIGRADNPKQAVQTALALWENTLLDPITREWPSLLTITIKQDPLIFNLQDKVE